ncbi:SPOR domain-containing protein [Bradyrhizobium sp. STM 3557]|uniref:SPOR domain-containing protein n=1 Tax=Bradyrhizobium sp. STM 3557 TaxID=578920 RepID=UPI00388E335D
MADRYQDRSFPSDGFGRGGDPRADADPLAELARLIGQTDAQSGRGTPPVAPRPPAARQPAEPEPSIPPGPPSWMQRANRQEIPKSQQQVPASARDPFAELPREPQRAAAPPPFPGAVQGPSDLDRDFAAQDFEIQQAPHPAAQRSHPNQDFADELAKLDFSVGESRHRFGAGEADPHFQREVAFDEQGADPSRYDEALYGQLGPAQQEYHGEQDYEEDQFGYQDGYDEAEEEEAPKRRGGKVMVVAILALGVLGTSGAFAYRTYFSGTHSSEPPIIRADNSPTKIMASPADTSPKVPDRLLGGDGGEKLVSREETPVDPSRSIGGNSGNSNGGPRVVFPQPPNQNGSPPSTASVAPTAMASAAPSVSNGTMPNGDPRPIKTLSVSGNQGDAATAPPPAPKPAKVIAAQPVLPHNSPANANASANNAPMAITPQQAPSRVASVNPAEQPSAAAPAASGGGGYLVSISSQISEADAISSYQAVQAKYSSVLGSYSPVIKRVEPNGKVMYRAAVGPFATRDEANKMCGTLKSAGGQCFAFSNQ